MMSSSSPGGEADPPPPADEPPAWSLDAYLVRRPPPSPPPEPEPPEPEPATTRPLLLCWKERFANLRDAARDHLATEALVRNVARVCARENAAGEGEEGDGDEEDAPPPGRGTDAVVVDRVFDAFRERYPSLTRERLAGGIMTARRGGDGDPNNPSVGSDVAREEGPNDDGDDDDGRLERIVAAVESEMERYHERIDALRRRRKRGRPRKYPDEEYPPPKPKDDDCFPRRKRIRRKPPGGYPCPHCGRAFASDHGLKYHVDKKVCQEPNRRRKRSPGPVENTPENFLMNEIVKKYAELRKVNERPHRDQWEALVNEAKREHQLEHIEIPDMHKYQRKISAKWRQAEKAASEAEVEPRPANRTMLVIEEIYERYSQEKFAHGDKLPFGTLDAIIDEVKAEHADAVIPYKSHSLKVKIQNRFRKEHPEFEETNDTAPGQCRVTELSEEARKRRQRLLNEVTTRYARLREEREASGARKLKDGTLERVIKEAEDALGIHEFEVNKDSIHDRIRRGNLVVNTVGRGAPVPASANAIDGTLVSTVNAWLNEGVSVTSGQGLALANMLLKGKNLGKDDDGNDIMLDEMWWRKFLRRNKRNLNCLVD